MREANNFNLCLTAIFIDQLISLHTKPHFAQGDILLNFRAMDQDAACVYAILTCNGIKDGPIERETVGTINDPLARRSLTQYVRDVATTIIPVASPSSFHRKLFEYLIDCLFKLLGVFFLVVG